MIIRDSEPAITFSELLAVIHVVSCRLLLPVVVVAAQAEGERTSCERFYDSVRINAQCVFNNVLC